MAEQTDQILQPVAGSEPEVTNTTVTTEDENTTMTQEDEESTMTLKDEDTPMAPIVTILVGPHTVESTVYKSSIGPIDLSRLPISYRPKCIYSGEPQDSYESKNWFHVIGCFPSALPHGLENLPYDNGRLWRWEVKKHDIWEETKGSKSFWVCLSKVEYADDDEDDVADEEREIEVVVEVSRAYVGLEDRSMETSYSFMKNYRISARGGRYDLSEVKNETKDEWLKIPGYTHEHRDRDTFDVFEVAVFMCELTLKNATLSSVPFVPTDREGKMPNPFTAHPKVRQEPIALDQGGLDLFNNLNRVDPYDIGPPIGRPLSPCMDWEIGHPDPIPPTPLGPIEEPPQDLVPGRGCPPLAPGYDGPYPGDGTLPPVPPTKYYMAPYISPELRLKVIQYQNAHGMRLDKSNHFYFGRQCRPEHPKYDDDRDPRFTTGNEEYGPVELPNGWQRRGM